MGFRSSQYNQDVWIIQRENGGYDYICTHVDDFKIVAHDPHHWMVKLQEQYHIKDIGPPSYYLGNNYKLNKKGQWFVGAKKYIKEAISRVE